MFTRRPADAHAARALYGTRFTRELMLMMRVSAGPGVHGGQLMLMMRGLCRNWRGQRQADADDVWPLRDQVYTETG